MAFFILKHANKEGRMSGPSGLNLAWPWPPYPQITQLSLNSNPSVDDPIFSIFPRRHLVLFAFTFFGGWTLLTHSMATAEALLGFGLSRWAFGQTNNGYLTNNHRGSCQAREGDVIFS